MKKILVLEDEANIRSFVVINLNRAGYETIEAGSGEEALEQLRLNPDVGVALLDIMLPDMDGFEVCRRIRAGNSKIGIIMLTARTQEMDKVTGFMTGADDYVTKPYSYRELLARLKAVLRRSRAVSLEPEQVLVAGRVRMDVERHEVRVDDEPVSMPLREFELLELFLRHPGRVLTRRQIIERLWGPDYEGDTKTLDVHVKRLRGRVEMDASKPVLITTVRGLGYRLDSGPER